MTRILIKSGDHNTPSPTDCISLQVGRQVDKCRYFIHFASTRVHQDESDALEAKRMADPFADVIPRIPSESDYVASIPVTKTVPIYGRAPHPTTLGMFSPYAVGRANATASNRDAQLVPGKAIKRNAKAAEAYLKVSPRRIGFVSHPIIATARLRLAMRVAAYSVPEKECLGADGYYKEPPKGKIICNPRRICSAPQGATPQGGFPNVHDPGPPGPTGAYLAALAVLSDGVKVVDQKRGRPSIFLDPESKGTMPTLSKGAVKTEMVTKELVEAATDLRDYLKAAVARDYNSTNAILRKWVQTKSIHLLSATIGHRNQLAKPAAYEGGSAIADVFAKVGKERTEDDFVGNFCQKNTTARMDIVLDSLRAAPGALIDSILQTSGRAVLAGEAEGMRSRILVMADVLTNLLGKAVDLWLHDELVDDYAGGLIQMFPRIRDEFGEAIGPVRFGLLDSAGFPATPDGEEQKARLLKIQTTRRDRKAEGDTRRCDHSVTLAEMFAGSYYWERAGIPRASALIRWALWCSPRYAFCDRPGRSGLTAIGDPTRAETHVGPAYNPTGIWDNGPQNFKKTFCGLTNNIALLCKRRKNRHNWAQYPGKTLAHSIAWKLKSMLKAAGSARDILQILADSVFAEGEDSLVWDIDESLEILGGYVTIVRQYGPTTGLLLYDSGRVGIHEEQGIGMETTPEWNALSGFMPGSSIRDKYARMLLSPCGEQIRADLDLFYRDICGMEALELADCMDQISEELGFSISIPDNVRPQLKPLDFEVLRDHSQLGRYRSEVHPWVLEFIAFKVPDEVVNEAADTLVDGLANTPLPVSNFNEMLAIEAGGDPESHWVATRE
jgi:hypothetical protein